MVLTILSLIQVKFSEQQFLIVFGIEGINHFVVNSSEIFKTTTFNCFWNRWY
jgi:hypothetical protein